VRGDNNENKEAEGVDFNLRAAATDMFALRSPCAIISSPAALRILGVIVAGSATAFLIISPSNPASDNSNRRDRFTSGIDKPGETRVEQLTVIPCRHAKFALTVLIFRDYSSAFSDVFKIFRFFFFLSVRPGKQTSRFYISCIITIPKVSLNEMKIYVYRLTMHALGIVWKLIPYEQNIMLQCQHSSYDVNAFNDKQ